MTKSLLYQGQPGTSAAAAVVSATSARTIDQASVVNVTASDAWLSVWLVQNGDTAADDTLLYDEMTIAAGGTPVTLGALVNMAVPAQAAVHLQAETASALTVTISGRS